MTHALAAISPSIGFRAFASRCCADDRASDSNRIAAFVQNARWVRGHGVRCRRASHCAAAISWQRKTEGSDDHRTIVVSMVTNQYAGGTRVGKTRTAIATGNKAAVAADIAAAAAAARLSVVGGVVARSTAAVAAAVCFGSKTSVCAAIAATI